jgi:hypothetical protein
MKHRPDDFIKPLHRPIETAAESRHSSDLFVLHRPAGPGGSVLVISPTGARGSRREPRCTGWEASAVAVEFAEHPRATLACLAAGGFALKMSEVVQ